MFLSLQPSRFLSPIDAPPSSLLAPLDGLEVTGAASPRGGYSSFSLVTNWFFLLFQCDLYKNWTSLWERRVLSQLPCKIRLNPEQINSLNVLLKLLRSTSPLSLPQRSISLSATCLNKDNPHPERSLPVWRACRPGWVWLETVPGWLLARSLQIEMHCLGCFRRWLDIYSRCSSVLWKTYCQGLIYLSLCQQLIQASFCYTIWNNLIEQRVFLLWLSVSFCLCTLEWL